MFRKMCQNVRKKKFEKVNEELFGKKEHKNPKITKNIK